MKHFKHLLGRYKIGEAENAVKHAKSQFDSLLKSGKELKDNWVEFHVFLYDTKKEKA